MIIFEFIFENKYCRTKDHSLRAPINSVCKHNSTRVDEDERADIFPQNKCKARTVLGMGGEEPAIKIYSRMRPRILVSYDIGGKRRAKIINVGKKRAQ